MPKMNDKLKFAKDLEKRTREANRSRSKSDFKNRISICESEASETHYWMEIIVDANWLTKKQIEWEYNESKELLALFTTIGKNIH
jgi:four helix bundle protein